mmetsp:Transcript_8391/g.21332  ORF Transcript_8391/g.21332 Transcript_8391/m.21332 type:complete len:208 (+) Transcript_8391:147-770(+)
MGCDDVQSAKTNVDTCEGIQHAEQPHYHLLVEPRFFEHILDVLAALCQQIGCNTAPEGYSRRVVPAPSSSSVLELLPKSTLLPFVVPGQCLEPRFLGLLRDRIAKPNGEHLANRSRLVQVLKFRQSIHRGVAYNRGFFTRQARLYHRAGGRLDEPFHTSAFAKYPHELRLDACADCRANHVLPRPWDSSGPHAPIQVIEPPAWAQAA